jgi:ABC-2 type transport system ATP-binding protein
VDRAEFSNNVDELVEMLDIAPLLDRQVRALSLGERMRAGLANALVYRPSVLFLDEPTIGLDVSAAAVVRRFVADHAARTGASVLLTSHYMADVESLCRRVILIDRSRIRFDGELSALATALSPFKLIKVSVEDGSAVAWERFGEVEEADALLDGKVSLRVPREVVPKVTGELLAHVPVADLTVEDPPLDLLIDRFYRSRRR